MKEKAKSFFDTGELYVQAARLLGANGLHIPSLVNGGLALELYFKALYMLEFDTEFKTRNGHSHDFLKLFDELSPETKSCLVNAFKKEVGLMNQAEVKSHNKIISEKTGAIATKDFRQNIAQWRDAFVELRYLHEFMEKAKAQPKMTRTWNFLDQIAAAVRYTVFDKEPSWMI